MAISLTQQNPPAVRLTSLSMGMIGYSWFNYLYVFILAIGHGYDDLFRHSSDQLTCFSR